MIEIKIPESMFQAAVKRLEGMKIDTKRPLTQYGCDRERTLTGFLGEQVVSAFLREPLVNDFDFDLLFRGWRVDIKTTKGKSRPLPEYEAAVSNIREQDADIYLFVRVCSDFKTAWIVGFLPVTAFRSMATKRNVGDKTGCGGVLRFGPQWFVTIKQLMPPEGLGVLQIKFP